MNLLAPRIEAFICFIMKKKKLWSAILQGCDCFYSSVLLIKNKYLHFLRYTCKALKTPIWTIGNPFSLPTKESTVESVPAVGKALFLSTQAPFWVVKDQNWRFATNQYLQSKLKGQLLKTEDLSL